MAPVCIWLSWPIWPFVRKQITATIAAAAIMFKYCDRICCWWRGTSIIGSTGVQCDRCGASECGVVGETTINCKNFHNASMIHPSPSILAVWKIGLKHRGTNTCIYKKRGLHSRMLIWAEFIFWTIPVFTSLWKSNFTKILSQCNLSWVSFISTERYFELFFVVVWIL